MSVQKALRVIRWGHEAGLAAAKPLVAMTGGKAVERIAQRSRDQPGHPRQAPWAAQRMAHAQQSRRMLPDAIAIDQQQRLQALDLQAGLRQESLAMCALYRRKTQHATLVVAQEKLHPSVAEQALRIKNNNHGAHGAWASSPKPPPARAPAGCRSARTRWSGSPWPAS